MASAFPETTITIEGRTYRQVLDINAQALLEDRLSAPGSDVTFQQVAALAMKGSVRHVRWMFWASLQRHHPDLTVEQAGDLMAASDAVSKALAKVLEQTTPDSDDAKELGIKPRRPRKARTA